MDNVNPTIKECVSFVELRSSKSVFTSDWPSIFEDWNDKFTPCALCRVAGEAGAETQAKSTWAEGWAGRNIGVEIDSQVGAKRVDRTTWAGPEGWAGRNIGVETDSQAGANTNGKTAWAGPDGWAGQNIGVDTETDNKTRAKTNAKTTWIGPEGWAGRNIGVEADSQTQTESRVEAAGHNGSKPSTQIMHVITWSPSGPILSFSIGRSVTMKLTKGEWKDVLQVPQKQNEKVPIALFNNSKSDPWSSEFVFDIIRNLMDPEHPHTLEQLSVVSRDMIEVNGKFVDVAFAPTIPHCSQATLIGLMLCAKLKRCLPFDFKYRVRIKSGTHEQEDQINKQLSDTERVEAALENEAVASVINRSFGEVLKKKNWNPFRLNDLIEKK